ncbi:MAG: hypothetical protein J5574_07260, partial [Lachnospiraceae bacterium]|nr:hypothetical protein [Lachnospiraceae bacterium]
MKKTSISDLKLAAKDRLLGSYGIATGTFALVFALIYTLMIVLMYSLIGSGLLSLDAPAQQDAVRRLVVTNVFSLVIGALSSVMYVGYMYVIMRIARGETPVASDVFFVFKNHPDKVIIISLIMSAVQIVLLLPANIVNLGGKQDGKMFLLWTVLYLFGLIAAFVVNIYFALCYLIYIDDTDMNVGYF